MSRTPSGWATAAVLTLLAGGPATAGSAAQFSTIYGSGSGAPLAIDTAGALYGVGAGGQPGCGGSDCGAVFKLTPPASPGGAWTEEVLYRFTGGADGGTPRSGLVFDAAGALYGTASEGGNPGCGGLGCGTVFKLTPPSVSGGAWSEIVLYSFSGGADGGTPSSGLVFDGAGALYGVTPVYPAATLSRYLVQHCAAQGCGVVFKLTPAATAGGPWMQTVLHAFTGCTDGFLPSGSLVFDAAGALYGATAGGADCVSAGQTGTVYQLMPPQQPGGSWMFNTLYAFAGNDGLGLTGSLIFDAAGALYGTATEGGSVGNCGQTAGCGTVFKLSPPSNPGGAWNLSTLYAFSGGADGAWPTGSPALDASGALYGTTAIGGTQPCNPTQDCGVVFKLTPSAIAGGPWIETVLYAFSGGSDGGFSAAGPILDGSGALYGTTGAFGPSGFGTVFKLTGLEVTATVSVFITGRGVVTSSPPGIDCGEGRTSCSASFPLASQVQLLPSFRRNEIFLGWNGNCHGRGACVVLMNADQSVGASFRPIR